jgi:tetratricopeptide (TPR) repeat protein
MKDFLSKQTFVLVMLVGCTVFAPGLQAAEEDLPETADVIFLKDGSRRVGKLAGQDGDMLRIQIRIIPGQPSATVGIPRSEVERIEFADDEERDEFLRRAEVADLLLAARYWGVGERFLEITGSPAARVGLRYAELLLATDNRAIRERALDLYRRIESSAWNENDRAAARRGRLRAMIATGNAAEAVAEARELAEAAEEPFVLIEAKYILASVAARELKDLEESNPRWEEDIFVRPERSRLYNESIDLFLFAPLFFGSDVEPAARGLWGAMEIYLASGDMMPAMETARDLLALYPGTPQAARAEEYLATLPEEIINQDNEKEARETIE